MKFYTGIGSRETPEEVLDLMHQVATALAGKGYSMRSGGAGGADTAFEDGVMEYTGCKAGLKEIYIPWQGFQNKYHGRNDTCCINLLSGKIQGDCYSTAENFHPNWERVSMGGRSLHSRNVLQVLGYNLNTPSDFVICYTKRTKSGVAKGGTAMAMSIAEANNVPVFNLYDYPLLKSVKEIMELIGEDI